MRKAFLSFITISFSILGCPSCWLDLSNPYWQMETRYVTDEVMNFGDSSEDQSFFISNNGIHSSLSFSLSVDQPWIELNTLSGSINKGEDVSISVHVNRTLLPEGENTGIITLTTDDSNIQKKIVAAIGYNDIKHNPSYINYGSQDDSATLTIRSLSGPRIITLNALTKWLDLSEYEISIPEYNHEAEDGDYVILVACKRDQLTAGEYSASIDVASSLGEKLFSVPVSVTVPAQDSITIPIDNCVFSLNKHLYWEGEDVVLELSIRNYKYLKPFELVKDESEAVDDKGVHHSISGSLGVLQPNETKVMKLYINQVDRDVRCFSRIVISIADLSEPIIFSNIDL